MADEIEDLNAYIDCVTDEIEMNRRRAAKLRAQRNWRAANALDAYNRDLRADLSKTVRERGQLLYQGGA